VRNCEHGSSFHIVNRDRLDFLPCVQFGKSQKQAAAQSTAHDVTRCVNVWFVRAPLPGIVRGTHQRGGASFFTQPVSPMCARKRPSTRNIGKLDAAYGFTTPFFRVC